jgi:hypothetical protein
VEDADKSHPSVDEARRRVRRTIGRFEGDIRNTQI